MKKINTFLNLLIIASLIFFSKNTTAQIFLTEDFEYLPIDWTLVNSSQTNKWVNGLAVKHDGKQSLYISKDLGVSNTYDVSSSSIVHAYKNINFPSAMQYNISFWWKGAGESNYDYLRVFLVDTANTPIAGTMLTLGQIGNTYNLQTNWTNANILIPGSATSQTKRLVFSWKNDNSMGTQPPIAIDDIVITAIVCPAPKSLNAANFTSNSASLSWVAGSTETTWNIQYGYAGFPLNSGTIVSAASNPFTLTGLSPSSNYSYYVQAVCSPGVDSSYWAGPFSFTTLCGIANIPYCQNFETTTVPAIPNCNTIENAGTGNNWVTVSAPSATFQSKTLKYSYHFTNPANAWFYTSGLNLIGGQSYHLTFRYGNNTTNYTEKLKVAYGTSATSASMTNILLNFPNINQGVSQNASIDFTPAYSGVYYLGFNAYSDANQYYLYVDDILIDFSPTCPPPSSLTANNLTLTSANLSWLAGGSETSWNIEFGQYDFIPGTGVKLNTSSNPFTLTGLSPNNSYTFYVQAICIPGVDSSVWVGPYHFSTPCGVTNVPYSQNFETAIVPAIPNCNTIENAGTGNNWVTQGPSYNFPSVVLKYGYHPTNAANAWFYTPGINFTAGQSYRLSFIYGKSYSVDIESLRIAYGTAAQSTAMIDTILDFPSISATTPQDVYVDFTPTTTGVYYIGFIAYSIANQFNLFVDNILVDLSPTCPAPRNPIASNITLTSANLAWTNGGTETSWKIEYGLQGFTPGTGTTITVNTNPYTLTGLTMTTNYSYYVKAVCGVGDESIWVGPVSFSTPQIPTNVPFHEDFETLPPSWSIVNGTLANTWNQGSAVAHYGTKSMYISNDLGVTNVYSINSTSIVHVYRDITFPAGSQFNLSFWWKSLGETQNFDYLKLYLVDLNTVPTAGNLLASGAIGINYYNKPTWNHENIILPGTYANHTWRLVFTWRNDNTMGNQPPAAIDDIDVTVITCPAPLNLNVSNSTHNSIDLNWMAGGTESSWQIEYGLQGFAQGTGTLINTNSKPYHLAGLSVNTDYSFYVKAICGVGNESVWVGPYDFSTTQIPATIPFTEDFELTATEWSIINGNQVNKWTKGTATAHSGMQAEYISNDFGTNNTYTITSTSIVHIFRDIAFPSGNQFKLSFWWKGVGENQNFDYLNVFLIDVNSKPIAGTQISTGALGVNYFNQSSWKQENIILPGTYANQTWRLVFSWKNDNSMGNQPPAAIDNIEIREITCPAPTLLRATNITPTTASLSWTPIGTEIQWKIEYGLQGFTPGTGTLLTANTNPFSINGLTPNTGYSYYLRAICGTGNLSTWVGPYSFTSACNYISVPYSQNFETAVVPSIPDCNTIENAGTGNNWFTSNAPGDGFTSKVLRYDFHPTNPANAWFYTPGLNLTGGNIYHLSFKYGKSTAMEPERLRVAYGNDSYSNAMTNELLDFPNITQNNPQNASVNFSPTTSGTYFIGFNVYSDEFGWFLYVDDILIESFVGIEKSTSNSGVKIYPNPTKNNLTIDLENLKSAKIEIYNIIGEQIYYSYNNRGILNIDLSAKSRGIYIVKIIAGDKVITQKIEVID